MNERKTKLVRYGIAFLASAGVNLMLLMLIVSLTGEATEPAVLMAKPSIRMAQTATDPSESEMPPSPSTSQGKNVSIAAPSALELPNHGEAEALHLPAYTPELAETVAPSLGSALISPGRLPAFEPPAAPRIEPAGPLVIPNLSDFYPEGATRDGIEGRSLVRIRVGVDGKIVFAETVDSSPEGVFDEAAKEACLHGVSTPAKQDGVPVESERIVELEWSLGDRNK
ncbi:MAG: TonB family protein [Planctomycetes bacterium]|nr:TonB family protein [Planctomycetota bacterium]NUQ33829.1 TonB family protein [Planctomycetaceae bacterium]